jgi:isoquinoline 1-oxidoreductase beta subunit
MKHTHDASALPTHGDDSCDGPATVAPHHGTTGREAEVRAPGRRLFMQAWAAAGGGLVLGIPFDADAAPKRAGAKSAAIVSNVPVRAGETQPRGNAFGAYLSIRPDGSVLVTSPVIEMGQGAQSSIAAVLADELDAEWERLVVEEAPVGTPYQRPDVTKYQLTSGSWSLRLWYGPMRNAGAAAREMLVAAAARQWGVEPASCSTAAGRVLHVATGRSLGYGELASAAAQLPVPQKPVLKTRDRQRLVGRPLARTDIPRKVDGSGIYGVDVRVPGMAYAAMRQAPVYGAEVESVDSRAVRRRPGIVDVITVPGAVVVVAESWWQARQALDALTIRFKPTAFDGASTDALMAEERDKLAQKAGTRFRGTGDVAAAAAGAARTVSVDYTVPFLHHAPMEPMNCTASVTPGLCELWVPTQCHTTALEAARRLTGLPEAQVKINATLLGGAFGRRIHTDFIEPAILASRAVGRPVKLIWSREEDMTHGYHRPAMSARMTGTLDAAGAMTSLSMRIVGPSVHEKFWPAFFKDGLDYAAVMALTTKNAASGTHYGVPNQYVDYIYQPTHVPIGYWRSVGASHNGYFMEGFIDEMAQAAGADPAAFRRSLLKDSARGLAVLDKAVAVSGWAQRASLPAGHGLGIAFFEAVDSVVAQVAHVSLDGNRLRVHRIWAVIDCGLVINPDTVQAQMQGGIVNAWSATLAEEITVKDGRAQQTNFHDYPIQRMAGSPPVEVHIMESGGPLGGVGEAMVPTVAPAVCNAIFAASGRRIRSLPLKAHGLVAA